MGFTHRGGGSQNDFVENAFDLTFHFFRRAFIPLVQTITSPKREIIRKHFGLCQRLYLGGKGEWVNERSLPSTRLLLYQDLCHASSKLKNMAYNSSKLK